MKTYTDLDKMFLLVYTCVGYDGMRHSYHAWFSTEERMKRFVLKEKQRETGFESELSIEVLAYRMIGFVQ